MNKGRHAYMIIAHHEFSVLEKLIGLLDDARNDLYLHIDKKVRDLPDLQCRKAGLFLLEDRVDVRWGHLSQIESEFILFEAAYNKHAPYDRYHLISGTHLPLKSQDYMHDFFRQFSKVELLNFLYTNAYESKFKLRRFHYFLKHYRSSNAFRKNLAQMLWHVLIKVQNVLGIAKPEPKAVIKANNWVSLTPGAVGHLIGQKERILKQFKRTFCGDEFFVPYALQSGDDEFNIRNEARLLFNEFAGGTPRTLTGQDYEFLIQSDYLFARKFSASDMEIVDKIAEHLKPVTA